MDSLKTARPYLFTSSRLGFRCWEEADLPLLAEINAHPEVMRYFPATADTQQSREFMANMNEQFTNKGYCYFAVDLLETKEWIGFIGISEKTFDADFTPCLDVGWRLAPAFWRKGLATEGAQRCLQFAFENLKAATVYSIAPEANLPSIGVMKKVGMHFVKTFTHPQLLNNERLKSCALYRIDALK